MKSALFLDRDGVINNDYGYVHLKENFDFIDGIFDLVKLGNSLGLLVLVATNQAGIGRGIYTEEQFMSLTKWMLGVFLSHDCKIDSVEHCPFHPVYGIGDYKRKSIYRKPNPGMITKLAKTHNVSVGSSVFIGDKKTDIEAGISAGIQTNILLGKHAIDLDCIRISNLEEAQKILVRKYLID